MEPRMLDKINDLNRMKVEMKNRQEDVKTKTNDIIEEVLEILEKASIHIDDLHRF